MCESRLVCVFSVLCVLLFHNINKHFAYASEEPLELHEPAGVDEAPDVDSDEVDDDEEDAEEQGPLSVEQISYAASQ